MDANTTVSARERRRRTRVCAARDRKWPIARLKVCRDRRKEVERRWTGELLVLITIRPFSATRPTNE